MVRRILSALLLLVLSCFGASGPINVVCTTSSMGMLVRTVGGAAVKVTVLAPPDRDAHYLLARPSMMIALRRADLLVAVGAELEVGWIPAALQAANNPKVLPSTMGYFEGAAQIDLIDKGEAADRSRGDVHPMGNPHYYMDPLRMALIARSLAGRLGAFDPSGSAKFSASAEAFAAETEKRVAAWKQQAAGAPGVVFYHKDGDYLAELLGVPILGYVEPLPGLPPTAAHLKELVQQLKGRKGVIIYDSFHSPDGPEFLSKNLGWKNVELQLECDLDADGSAYLDHIGKWVDAILSGKL